MNAVYVWGIARARRGRVLLRIEDHDRQRSRREYEAAILDDLAWLGFVADGPPVRQSERGGVYADALERLHAQGLVYACDCSRADIERANGARRLPPPLTLRRTGQPSDDSRYPGTCRNRGLDITSGARGRGIRVRLEPTVERFNDLIHGPQEQRPSEQCGDLLARDREGNWTYQFAAAVDDFAQAVTLVIRGDDLLESTGRQIQLARLLGRAEPPLFAHHGLVMKTPSQKLSKSDGDSGVRDLRIRGWAPETVIGRAARLAGLIAEERDVRAEEVSTIIGSLGSVGSVGAQGSPGA